MKKLFNVVVAAAVCGVGAQVQAAQEIDAFTVVQSVADLTTGGPGTGLWAAQTAESATIFGGYRDIYVEKAAQPAFDGSRGVRASAGGGEFSFSEDVNQLGYAILRWDGAVSNGNPLAPDVSSDLGSLLALGAGVDFTYTSDFVFNIAVCIYTDLSNYACAQQVTQDTGVGNYVTDSVLWSEFVNVAGAVDFADVHAIDVIFNGDLGKASIDLALTPPTGFNVPEPGSLALTGLALLGLGAVRRGRKS